MPGHYKIKRIDYKEKPDRILANNMVYWGRIMSSMKMVPYVDGKGWAGNIGFRKDKNIWVTCSNCMINDIKLEDIIGITKVDKNIGFFGHQTKKPTSEWEIYWEIFKQKPYINAILHGHDSLTLETAERLKGNYPDDVALTKSVTKSGSTEFRDEILEFVNPDSSHIYLIGREHGFFALGKSFEEAGEIALIFKTRAAKFKNRR